MKLNIYKNKKIVKTYTADSCDLPFGVLEDVAEKFNLDELKGLSKEAIATHVMKSGLQLVPVIKEVMLDVFEGLTPDELRHARVSEMRNAVVDIIRYTISELMSGESSSKN